MTSKELAEIEQRAKKATPGTMEVAWHLSGHAVVASDSGTHPNGDRWWISKPVSNIYGYDIRSVATRRKIYGGVLETELDEKPKLPPDMILMMHAREDLLALIAEVHRLKKALNS